MFHLDFLWALPHLSPMKQLCINGVTSTDRHISDVRRHIADQQTYIRRMIVQAAPTQTAEDQLRELEQELLHLRAAHGHRNDRT
jgi:ribosomal protein L29